MMQHRLFNDPEHWRRRAAEARVVAEAITDAEAKATMLRMAADYERIAVRATARQLSETNDKAAG
jgi:hypothetical protein